jgi:hypothetical protein
VLNEEVDFEELAPWLVIAIALAGYVMRVFLLAKNGLWLDEAFSVWMAGRGPVEMLQWIVRIDQHPPLYYLLLHYWMTINGETPYRVRLLSVLFGAGTIPIIYLIGKRMSGVVMGLSAAMLLAFSLFNIYFAQEARMYTLLAFNAAAAIYALVRLLTDPHASKPIGAQFREYLHAWHAFEPVEPDNKEEFSYKNETRHPSGWRAWISRHRWPPIRAVETDLAWAAFIVFSAAAMLSHNTAVFFPLAANIFVLGLMFYQKIKRTGSPPAFQAPSFGNWAKAQIVLFLLWSPWLVSFFKQAGAVNRRFWIPEPTWDAVIEVLKSFLNPSAQFPASYAGVIWSLYAVVLCLGLAHFRKKFSQFLFLAALFAIPFLGELLVSIHRPVFFGRTLIWTTIPLFLLLAAGIAQLKYRFLMILALGSLCAINLFSAADYYRYFQKEDWNTAAGYVANFAEKDDLILFNSNFVQIPFNYYFKDYESRYSLQVKKQGVPLDLFDSGVPEPEMTANDIPGLISLLRGHDRVWLVYSHDSYTDPMGLIPETLASQMKLIRTRDFYGGQVRLYETP